MGWVAVPERHPQGHGWHVHVAVGGYVPYATMTAAWKHGHVQSPRGRSFSPDRVARYLGKRLGEGCPAQAHRYSRSKGLTVTVRRSEARSYAEARHQIVAHFDGRRPRYEWSSDEDPSWTAPPVTWIDYWMDYWSP